MTPMAAASMVGIIGLINGLGRIFWSTISDYLGRSTVYVVFFLIQIFAFYALAETSSVFIFQLIVFVIISCYGGGFSTQGWFTDNYLPYRRPPGMTPWPHPIGLLHPVDSATRIHGDSRDPPAVKK